MYGLLHKLKVVVLLAWQAWVDRAYGPWLLRGRGIECAGRPRLYGLPCVRRHPQGRIRLGTSVALYSRPESNVLYLPRPCVLRTCAAGAEIVIGDRVSMSGTTIVAATRVEIGARTMIGAEAMLVDTDFHPLAVRQRAQHPTAGAVSRPIRVGEDVFIGARAVILKGVAIGDGAVVGASAVVTHNVAPGDIVAGNPARVIGSTAETTERENAT